MTIPAPPEGSYRTCFLAEAALQQFAEAHGFAIIRNRSKVNKQGEIRKVWVQCDKSGKSKSEKQQETESRDRERPYKARMTGSRKTECEFLVAIKRDISSLMWDIEVIYGDHNHEPSLEPSAHPALRKLTNDESILIKSMSARHQKDKDILLALQQVNPNTHITMQDIRNEKKRITKEFLGGRTKTKALVDLLIEEDGDWSVSWDKNSETERLNRLFFAHYRGIALAHNYPEVLLIDATYRTNIYNMPLLHFAGVTPTSKTFSIGFAFMSSESEAMYQWVLSQFQSHVQGDQLIPTIIITDNEGALLNALSAIFPDTPHLLCRWHAEKNVL